MYRIPMCDVSYLNLIFHNVRLVYLSKLLVHIYLSIPF